MFRSSELQYLPKNVQDAVGLARIEADTDKKATAPPKPLASPAPKTDNWQRIKECATQAEKVVQESHIDRDNEAGAVVAGQHVPLTNWENHYSPTYGRCYLAIHTNRSLLDGAGKTFPKVEWHLLDPFERSTVAWAFWDGPTDPSMCSIEGKVTDCEKVRGFISEHLKN
jgi:hypothetical protein